MMIQECMKMKVSLFCINFSLMWLDSTIIIIEEVAEEEPVKGEFLYYSGTSL